MNQINQMNQMNQTDKMNQPRKDVAMQINERVVPQGIILDVVGDLTYANRGVFKAAVDKAKSAGCRHLIVNLEKVRFIDSAGLGLLVLVSQNLKLIQAQLSVLKPQLYVREIMSLANIPKMIPIYDSEDAVSGARAA
ncbi:MAG: STAS domain-containing protein [Nitrospira sp. CG24E]|nr:MAG: STAS domain-containing protein [Nitrospira sp. CG24E]